MTRLEVVGWWLIVLGLLLIAVGLSVWARGY